MFQGILTLLLLLQPHLSNIDLNLIVSKLTNHWLTDELKAEIRKVLEPKYERRLKDSEIVEIAENLSGFIESYLKFKWRQKYRYKTSLSSSIKHPG